MTHDISRFTKAKIFSAVGKQTPMFARFSTVAGERGAADAGHDIRGFALKFYTEEGDWDIVGNNTPVFFFRDPLPIEGEAAHYNHCGDDDHWEQPGNLFRLMTPARQQVLFDNTARAIGDARRGAAHCQLPAR